MLLKELVNHCKIAEQKDEAEKFQECYEIASEITKNVNEMMEAGRIELFPGDITKQVRVVPFLIEFLYKLLGRIYLQRFSGMQGAKPQEEHIFQKERN
jgi:hypothetical protein